MKTLTRNGVEYEVLAELATGGSYEWAELWALRRLSDGQLFTIMDSGCSCGYWDPESASVWERPVASRAEIVRQASELSYVDEEPNMLRRFIEKVNMS